MQTGLLLDESVRDYLEQLASRSPTPGGGSVAALTGAAAAALGEMVCALTVGKPRFAAVEDEVRGLQGRFGRAREMLSRLVDEDAQAYLGLANALKLEKADLNRPLEIRQAAEVAATVPLETAAVAAEVFAALRRLGEIGNPNLQADITAGQHLAVAAVHAAAANVAANLSFVGDSERPRLTEQLARLQSAVS